MGVTDGVRWISDGLAVYLSVIRMKLHGEQRDGKSTDFRGRTCTRDWGNLNLVETEGIQAKDTLYMGINTHALKNDPITYNRKLCLHRR